MTVLFVTKIKQCKAKSFSKENNKNTFVDFVLLVFCLKNLYLCLFFVSFFPQKYTFNFVLFVVYLKSVYLCFFSPSEAKNNRHQQKTKTHKNNLEQEFQKETTKNTLFNILGNFVLEKRTCLFFQQKKKLTKNNPEKECQKTTTNFLTSP